MNNKSIDQLRAKIALQESQLDQLGTELSFLQEQLIRCGFPEGIKTLKETVKELLESEVKAS